MMRLLHCWQTRNALRSYVLGTLSERRSVAITRHLEECPVCRVKHTRERERLQLLGSLPPAEAPAGLADRTLALIESAGDESSANKLSRRYPAIERETSYGAWAAAAVLLVVLSGAGIWQLGNAREAARRASTQGNMKTLALAFKTFASESEGGLWPPVTPSNDAWSPDLDSVYREFLNDPQMLVSDQHPERRKLLKSLHEALDAPVPDYSAAERLMGESFGYLGYAVTDMEDFETVYQAKEIDQLPSDGSPIPEAGPRGSVPPLREGIERFMITDINNPAASATAQSTVPVLVEIATWKHKKSVEGFRGANVLYMDGHVEFVRFGTFPVVEPVLNALSGIELPE